MTPYGPVTFALLHDLRVRSLSWAERGVLFHLYLLAAASTDEKTIYVDVRTGEAATASWERALGKDGAAAVGRLIETGFVVTCPAGLCITIPARETAAKGREGGGAMVATIGGEERPQGAVAWQGKPSKSPSAQRARTDRALFASREKGMWKLIDPALSWDEWLATPEGCAFLADREREHPGYARWVTPQGNAGNAQGNTPGNTGGNTPPLPPQTPPSPRKNEEERETRAKGNAGNTPQGNTPGNTGGGVTQPRGAHPGLALLDAIRSAAGPAATLGGDPAMQVEFCDRLVALEVTGDEAEAMGEAMADPSTWWTGSAAPRHVALNRLRGYFNKDTRRHEWGPVSDLVAYVRGEAAKRAERERHGTAPTQAVTLPTPEEAQRLVDEARARGGLLARKKEQADG